MKDNLDDFDKSQNTPTVRQRKAAYKAWKTIRKKKREIVGKDTLKIDPFLTVNRLASLVNPETEGRAPTETKNASYGRGIIGLFHKTPPDIGCGEFWEVRWAFGCPLDCSYCYLRGTNRGNMRPRFVRPDSILKALDEVFGDPTFNYGKPAIFNTGELSDSLMKPELMRQIVDKFEEQKKHKVLLLTKMGSKSIGFLLEKPRRNTICAWSINAIDVAKRWEKAAPSPEERIRAASMVSSKGYEVRVRIDPMFPVPDWKQQYEDLIFRIISEFEPHRIILGTPRGLWKTIHYAEKSRTDMGWASFFAEDTGWGKKISTATRLEMYRFMFDKLHSLGYPLDKVSICKETTTLLSRLGIKFKPLTCQCYGQA